jgi:hypothetical protein
VISIGVRKPGAADRHIHNTTTISKRIRDTAFSRAENPKDDRD